ncbi:MAG: protein phosphatase 2C domain-containing protein [Pseudomonadota bacterium]
MTAPTTRIPVPPQPASSEAGLVISGAGLTHTGRVRSENEDAILTDPAGVLWAIADGMGGYGHGDVASDLVTGALSEIEDTAIATPALRAALMRANAQIQQVAQTKGTGAFGATVVAAMFQNGVAHIAWAGDCRAYLMRQRCLRLLTRDHTVVQDMIDQGLLRGEDSARHPDAHVVTRAVGYERELEVDALSVPVVPGDVLMLCSDGLTACLGDHDIADHMARGGSAEALCAALVQDCLERGAPDNVSVIAAQVGAY